ncbi:gamma-glutamylcyclotransferase family protein [Ruminococcus sp. Marseille-P6503]|uniref:gamma-glutamylcyclotransferase family protein n=1 Tax=Ruminococcus sp. Marseille-P6503 TaxID=2364796 RepID=UPI0013DDB699|nr:gamma-glutamylcyclotransferase family protein [Ruminococcus sp. Marseille-P6503]
MSVFYAAYGSNINTEQMKRRCPNAKIFGTGSVQDMQLAFNKVATLHSKPGMSSPVLLWELTEEDEKKLDVYEGCPHKYHKETVKVKSDGKIIEAMAYIMNDSKKQCVPAEEYYNRISKGYAQFGFDLIFLENAFDRALEYEESMQLTFSDYCLYDEITNLPNDLLFQAFVVGQCCERYGLAFTREEIKELTLFLSEDFQTAAFWDFEDYADAVFSDIAAAEEREKGVKYYAAYGSNMNSKQMSQRCPNSIEIGTGEIVDHQLRFCNYAYIQPCSDAVTPCVIWHIDSEDWRNLDRYEGFPSFYRKEEVDINFRGERKTAVVYIMGNDYEWPSLPQKNYLDGITQGYLEHGLDTAPLAEALNRTAISVKKQNKTGGRK